MVYGSFLFFCLFLYKIRFYLFFSSFWKVTILFFFNTFNYLFWLHQVFIAACRIFSCSMQTLSCGMWDLVPQPVIKLSSPALGVWNLSHWTTREVPLSLFLKKKKKKKFLYLAVPGLTLSIGDLWSSLQPVGSSSLTQDPCTGSRES